jgi:hypothetical protein
MLNGRFVQANLNSDGTRVKFLVGIDPVTKKCTWWGYDEDGCVVKWVMSKVGEDVWLSEGVGIGPKGKCAWKEKLTRIDENTVKEEIEHFMINGEQRETISTQTGCHGRPATQSGWRDRPRQDTESVSGFPIRVRQPVRAGRQSVRRVKNAGRQQWRWSGFGRRLWIAS